jgi:transposase InsO family protein
MTRSIPLRPRFVSGPRRGSRDKNSTRTPVLRRPRKPKQYLSVRYTDRLGLAGVEPSVGSVGDSYDHALAETINRLHKAEAIHPSGLLRSHDEVELATIEWVD